MRRILMLACLTLTACSKGGGKSAVGEVCLVGQNVFSQETKVQVAGTGAPNSKLFYNLTAQEAPLAAGQLTHSADNEQALQAGTVLTAVVKNGCGSKGLITSQLKLDTVAEKTGGARSYEFVLRKDTTKKELELMAADDNCVIGLSDTSIDSISSLPNDPMISEQGHFSQLKASEAYPTFFDAALGTRPSTVIAIIDTGVDLNHTDLEANAWINEDEIAGNNKDDDGNGYIDDVNGYNFANNLSDPKPAGEWKGNYHGTHVAGLAAARSGNKVGVSGVMGVGVKIMALNVFGTEPGAYSFNTENAIRYAADNGADIINMSIGGTSASASYKAAIQYAVSKGVTLLAAAGNEAREVSTEYFMTPGAYGSSISGMITVGSVDAENSQWSQFSNYSASYVELAAPGSENSATMVGLLSTLPNNGYGRLQGTSMATPVAAGAAALSIQLLRALGYAATPSRIENAIAASASTDSLLVTKVNKGRVLNLENVANYIRRYYPKKDVAEAGALSRISASGAALPCP